MSLNGILLVQTAGKSDLFLKSELKDRLSALLFASDQIGFVSWYHHHLSAWVAVVTRAVWWRSFPTNKKRFGIKKCIKNIKKQNWSVPPKVPADNLFQSTEFSLCCCPPYRQVPLCFCSAALMHFRHSGYDVVVVSHCEWLKRHFVLRFERQNGRTETHLKKKDYISVFLLLCRLSKINLDTIWICLAVWTRPVINGASNMHGIFFKRFEDFYHRKEKERNALCIV